MNLDTMLSLLTEVISSVFIVSLVFLVPAALAAQIVNVEKLRTSTDTTGISGSLGLAGSYFEKEDRIYTVSFNSHIQHKQKRNLYLLIGQVNWIKSNDTEFDEAAFLHFRHNAKLNDWLRWEAFTQFQYNKINRINLRWLIGTGPRMKVLDREVFKIYLGVIPMYEHEELDDDENPREDDVRLSNYLSFTIKLNDYLNLYSTTYYQPILYDWIDARVYNENSLTVKLRKALDITATFLYAWDPFPVLETPKKQITANLGLKYTF